MHISNKIVSFRDFNIDVKRKIEVDTHSSNREVRLDMLDGIGPSKLVPSNLLHKHAFQVTKLLVTQI